MIIRWYKNTSKNKSNLGLRSMKRVSSSPSPLLFFYRYLVDGVAISGGYMVLCFELTEVGFDPFLTRDEPSFFIVFELLDQTLTPGSLPTMILAAW